MKKCLIGLCFAFLFGTSFALEAKEGLMKILLIESSGRFNIYYLQDVSKGSYIPLLFERDPRTSSLNVLVDNKMYRLGESSEFRVTTRKTEADWNSSSSPPFCRLPRASASLFRRVRVSLME